MPDGKTWKVFCAGCAAALLGSSLGILFGRALAVGGSIFGLNYEFLVIFTLLVVGGVLFWFVLPIENKYFWLKVTGRSADSNSDDEWRERYKFAPATFFFIVGMVLSIRW